MLLSYYRGSGRLVFNWSIDLQLLLKETSFSVAEIYLK